MRMRILVDGAILDDCLMDDMFADLEVEIPEPRPKNRGATCR